MVYFPTSLHRKLSLRTTDETTGIYRKHFAYPSELWFLYKLSLLSLNQDFKLSRSVALSNSTRMVSDPLRASVLRFYSHSSRETRTIFSNGPSQRPSMLVFETSWTQWILGRRQSYPTKTQLTRSQQCQQKLELQQS